MTAEQLKQKLGQHFADAEEIDCQGDGDRFAVRMVASAFAGLSPVKRQQSVYKLFAQELQSGELHALSLRLLTPQEANAS